MNAVPPAKKAKLNFWAPERMFGMAPVKKELFDFEAPAKKANKNVVAMRSELERVPSFDKRSTSSMPSCETQNPEINITDRMSLGEGQDGDVTEDPSGSSSSFGDTVSGDDSASLFSDDEIDSHLGGGGQPSWLYPGYEEAFRLRKKKVTSHWRDFIQPHMVKCKWAELKLKRFQSQASMYNRLLAQYDQGRLSQLETVEKSGSRSLPFPHHRIKGDKTLQRKRRKGVEDTTDATSYMLQHYLFSHYENKGSSEENTCLNNDYTHSVKSGNDGVNIVEYEDLLEFGDEENSLARIFMKIDAMQARVHDLTSRVDTVIRENMGKFSSHTLSLFDPSDSDASTAQDPDTSSCDKDQVLLESPSVIPQPAQEPLVEELNVVASEVTNELVVDSPLSIVEVADQPVVGNTSENVPSKKNSFEIPIPMYLLVDTYERDYSATFMQPTAYICAEGARVEIGEFVEYDLDNEDEDWLQELDSDKTILTPEKFESILFKLEVLDHKAREKAGIATPTFGSPIPVHLQLDTVSEALQGQSIRYTVIQAVYSYWKEKRERWQKPILRRLQPPPPVEDTNPYNVFRPREKKPPPPVNETNPYNAFRLREKAHMLRTRRRERWQKPVLRRLQPPPPANDTNPYKVFRPREKAHMYHTRRRERWQKPVLRRLQPLPPVKDTNLFSKVCRPKEKAHKYRTIKPPPPVNDTNPDKVSIPMENKDHKLDTIKEQQQLPEWLNSLLSLPFFKPCPIHHSFSKNEMNVFCVDCCLSLCRYCLPSHSTHRLLQIRRYVYNDVLKLGEAEKLFDCKSVQPYTVNNWKVVFLNKRDTTRSPSISEHTCASCDRNLKDQYRFCSMSCKVDYILTEEGIDKLANYLRRCDTLTLPDMLLSGGNLTLDSVLEPDAATVSSINSTRNTVISTDASFSDDAEADEKPLKSLLIAGGWPDCVKRGMACAKKRRMLTRKQTGINSNVCQAENEKSSCFLATRHSSRLAGSGKRLANKGLNLALRS